MKNSSRFEEIDRIVEKRTLQQCLAKDIKMSSYLGGNPSNFHFLLV